MAITSGNEFPFWARNLTLYEVNLRQYTESGSIKEFRQHLPRLKKLGAGILWFMPVQPVGIVNRKGSLGSYYSIRDYCATEPSFGTLDEFRDMVNEIHSMGMYVILDWVANHTAWDHHWVKEQLAFYLKNEAGEVYPPYPDWADVIGLDYTNRDMRLAMIECMKFWLTYTGIDGFRCDMAHLVPTDFWEQARQALERTRPGLFMLAETDQFDLLNTAFHSSYDWKIFHAMNELAQGKISVSDLFHSIQEQLNSYPLQASLMRFISNHDENSWQGSELGRLACFLDPMAVLYFTLPGIPLIYSGQEAGNYRRLSFFNKDKIEWKDDKMSALYRRLAGLRKDNPSLWSGGDGFGYHQLASSDEHSILAFERTSGENSVLVILNLGDEPSRFHLAGELSSDTYTDLFNGNLAIRFGLEPCFDLPPYGYRVYYC